MKIVILAAGKSTRFSGGQKIFAPFWGARVIDVLLSRVAKLEAEVSLVLNADNFGDFGGESYNEIEKILQEKNYGTGAAVQAVVEKSGTCDGMIVFPADMPLIDSQILLRFFGLNGGQNDVGCDVCVGIARMPEGFEQYGRIILNNGKLAKIAEFKDHPEKTDFINTGVIFLSAKAQDLVTKLAENTYGEIFLTDIVELAKMAGLKVDCIELDSAKMAGFNTQSEYSNLLNLAQKQFRQSAIDSGAIFLDSESVFLSFDTKFEPGAVVEPNCVFGPGVFVRSTAHIKPFSYVSNCDLSGIIGPFAHIRSGQVDQGAQVGAFVEINRSKVAKMAKIKHLSYVGDSEIGENANIGAGVVVCNYDGESKHKTNIGNRAFLGANSTLIAPITIGSDAFLAAGSTYSQSVPDGEFSIAREQQVIKTNWKKQPK